jgi:hypothetical protein
MASAMKIAHGAAWMEVAFGFISLLAGSLIGRAIHDNTVFQYLAIIIPAVAGVFFFFKKNKSQSDNSKQNHGFIKGALLNLISIQVLLYWLIAMAYISTRWLPEINLVSILLFTSGIWMGKMAVLWIYAFFSKTILAKSKFLEDNINRAIGFVLMLSVLLQMIK